MKNPDLILFAAGVFSGIAIFIGGLATRPTRDGFNALGKDLDTSLKTSEMPLNSESFQKIFGISLRRHFYSISIKWAGERRIDPTLIGLWIFFLLLVYALVRWYLLGDIGAEGEQNLAYVSMGGFLAIISLFLMTIPKALVIIFLKGLAEDDLQ